MKRIPGSGHQDISLRAAPAALAAILVAIPSAAHAFIGFPPVSLFTLGLIGTHPLAFLCSFVLAIMFQSWSYQKHLGIPFKRGLLDAVQMKVCFLFYAIPLVPCCEFLGACLISPVFLISAVRTYAEQYDVALLALWMAASMALTAGCTSLIEALLMTNPHGFRIRLRVSALANAAIFVMAYTLLGVLAVEIAASKA